MNILLWFFTLAVGLGIIGLLMATIAMGMERNRQRSKAQAYVKSIRKPDVVVRVDSFTIRQLRRELTK